MGSECNPSKLRHDITMSKRTRRPLIFLQEETTKTEKPADVVAKAEEEEDEEEEEGKGEEENQENAVEGVADGRELKMNNNNHKSLEELIKSSSSRRSNSLQKHFNEEEKQMQMQQEQVVVNKQQEETLEEGIKFKKMVSRYYAKVLSHLIKAKRASSKKHVLRLTM